MKGLFWRHGQFTWTFVLAIAYLSVSLIVVDLLWRTIVAPFETLLIYAIVTDATVATLLIGAWLLLSRRVPPPSQR